ncbi:carboxypeptidase S [Mrakia frigida]|uniref:M20 family metallopeptidase n=1 Tax=Mrakia frigida TaxID=29902 RepID=UPI003FCC1953
MQQINEKQHPSYSTLPTISLPLSTPPPAPKKSIKARLGLPSSLLLLLLPAYLVLNDQASSFLPSSVVVGSSASLSDGTCYQPPKLTPKNELFETLDQTWKSDEFRGKAISWLSGAVKVDTSVGDAWGNVGEDERWKIFGPFHEYLEKAFPLVHQKLKLTKVNTWALSYEWTGSDPSLKPLLLTGHQDVVPIEKTTIDSWVHPPFSGHYDGTFIWGRGSVDDKSGLIGILSALESLLEADFVPRRTIVLASGQDEEASGHHGAKFLGTYLEETYGQNGFALLVDEGGGYAEAFGRLIAAPATGEKGMGDVRMTVETLGGHSSIPPDHTGIGLLSLLIAEVEAHPHKANLTRENPYYSLMGCAAEFAPGVEPSLRSLIKASVKSDKALKQLGDVFGADRTTRGLVGTTQAVDLIGGGVKVNALPEKSWAVVNHRINVASSPQELRERFTSVIKPKAKALNLTLTAWGKDIVEGPSVGHIVLENAFKDWLAPSPITPTTPETVGWQVLAGTIRSTHASRIKSSSAGENELEIVVSPAIMTGNTDTARWWSLTPQIYRYGHLSPDDVYTASGIHSVNEAIKATSFVNEIRFFGELIFNADEADF